MHSHGSKTLYMYMHCSIAGWQRASHLLVEDMHQTTLTSFSTDSFNWALIHWSWIKHAWLMFTMQHTFLCRLYPSDCSWWSPRPYRWVVAISILWWLQRHVEAFSLLSQLVLDDMHIEWCLSLFLAKVGLDDARLKVHTSCVNWK